MSALFPFGAEEDSYKYLFVTIGAISLTSPRIACTGVFQRKMAGKRMKLDIPATWETQTSMHVRRPCVSQS